MYCREMTAVVTMVAAFSVEVMMMVGASLAVTTTIPMACLEETIPMTKKQRYSSKHAQYDDQSRPVSSFTAF